ncbi:PREDICTED: regulator of G-protein signaling 17 isoform X2 [Chinchilla lanigera]|uniref:regulator of G-protein signaling 17 isoform X2 n=1 Tax=Chinchilla lanigera TaxID=34839 RepID=UPI00038EB101|nr:PREDICTED: regulator of G-protein signaling 17 isoform X2 [Chinchilla lanigera]
MRKRQQTQNEGTPAVSQTPGNQRPNNTCCFCWCCCCSCSCLTVRNEERGESAGRPIHTTKMESIQVLEESQSPTADEVLSWSQSFDKMMKDPAGRNLFREFLRTEYSEENLLFWLACEDLKKEQNKKVIEEKARMIYEDYISILSPKEVARISLYTESANAQTEVSALSILISRGWGFSSAAQHLTAKRKVVSSIPGTGRKTNIKTNK